MKRFGLAVLVGSLALNAALGIYALLAGDFGEVEARILFTSLCVSGTGTLVLACMPAWERGRIGPIPPIGVAASLVGFGLLVVVVWTENPPEPLWKSAVTLLVTAAVTVHASLLALAPLAPRFRWAFSSALGLSFLLAALVVSSIWGEWEDIGWFFRWLGVVAVLLAAFTVLVPILHRASRGELAAAPGPAEGVPVQFCPRCGGPVSAASAQESTCPACGARFEVRFLSSPPLAHVARR